MKRVLILLASMNLVLLAVVAGLFLLSEVYPLRPGAPLYSVQDAAEQWRLRLAAGEGRRAEVALDLVERRLSDLAQAHDQDRVQAAAAAFDAATNEAIRQIDAVPQDAQGALYNRLRGVLGQARVVVSALDAEGVESTVTRLTQRLEALQAAASAEQMVALVPRAGTLAQAEPIPFLDKDVDHSVYPLEGAHADVACEDCHVGGLYVETPTDCASCHPLPADALYPAHFEGGCEDCHGVESWAALAFDHVGVVECQSCHAKEAPEGHYTRSGGYWRLVAQLGDTALLPMASGGLAMADPCASCHYSVQDWDEALFDHLGQQPCQSCHPAEDPIEHPYAGGCTDCHGTADWQTVAYDHAGVSECRSCHLRDTPEDHYLSEGNSLWYVAWLPNGSPREQTAPSSLQECPGSCANCHQDTDDWQQVAFDHTEFPDCESCHLVEDTPDEHYEGQCAQCHNASDWAAVDFDHTDYQDCQTCHAAEGDHYPGECSTCHDTEDWAYSWFDHTGFNDCTTCHDELTPRGHYEGACDKCHSTEDWDLVDFDHTGYSDCFDCHGMADHHRGECSACHNTEDWAAVWFNHAGQGACEDCHQDEEPAGHYEGACATCHTTDRWDQPKLDHSGLASCEGCHITPVNHYPVSCSQCHDISDWEVVGVDHSRLTDAACSACHDAPDGHYAGECSACHNVERWRDVLFDHSGLTACLDCHTVPEAHWPGDCLLCHCTCDWYENHFEHEITDDCMSCHPAPDGHWPGQCSSCHNYVDWSEVTFDHTRYTDCNACHTTDRPADHPRGKCSNCHTTDTWAVPTATPTPELPTATPTDTPPPTATEEAEEGLVEPTETPEATATADSVLSTP
ncbi:MAG: hypothetical protein ACP5JJ_07345 [Anaerolineae bacterium]